MKIVQIEEYFHPDAGYQTNILAKYFASHGHESVVLAADLSNIEWDFFGTDDLDRKDRQFEQDYNVRIVRIPNHGVFCHRIIFKSTIFDIIRKENPDILYVHDNDTLIAMQCLSRYNRLRVPLILDTHMLEMASNNRFRNLYRSLYRWKYTPVILDNKIPVIRTQDDDYVQKCFDIPLEQAPWISFGSDTMLFQPNTDARNKFRQENNINDEERVVLYAGKITSAKGGLLLAQALKDQFHTSTGVVFCIVGNTTGDYGKEVEDLFNSSENRILRFPTQKYVDLAKYYQAADIAVFPKQCSLSYYDVQACDLPVLFEDNNINIDRARAGGAITFKADSVEDFRRQIARLVDMPADEFDRMRQAAVRNILDNYNYDDIAKQYEQILESEMIRQKRAFA